MAKAAQTEGNRAAAARVLCLHAKYFLRLLKSLESAHNAIQRTLFKMFKLFKPFKSAS